MNSHALKPFSRSIALCAASVLLINVPSFAQSLEKIDASGEHKGNITALALTSDGQRLMSLGKGEIIMRDAKTGKIINGFRFVPSGGVPPTFTLPVIQPGTSRVAYVFERDKRIMTTDMVTTKGKGLKGHTKEIEELVFSSDGKLLLTRTRRLGDEVMEVKVWDMDTMTELKDLSKLSILNDYGSKVCFADNSKELIVASRGKYNDQVDVQSLDTTTWQMKKRYPTLNAPDKTMRGKQSLGFYPSAFGPEGRTVLANQNLGDTFAFDVKTGHKIGHVPVKVFTWGFPATFQFTPSGKRLLVGAYLSRTVDKASHQWAVIDTTTWKLVRYIDIAGYDQFQLNGAAISPDGRTVYARLGQKILRYDVATGKQLTAW